MNRQVLPLLFILTAVLLSVGCGSTQSAGQSTAGISLSTAVPTSPVAPASTETNSGGAAPTSASSGSSSDTVKLVLVPEKSEARYRVREQLASLSLPSDAIGRTKAITGTIVGKMDGSIVSSESKFTVDLRTLQSDRSMRDNFLRRNVLQTDTYPYATFVPTQAPGLPLTLPASGDVSFKLIGDLTVRNVTKQVTWDASGHVQGDEATGTAKTTFTFEDMGLERPSVPVVLSIVDSITLELDLDLQRVAN